MNGIVNPSVSVIIPTFNRGWVLREAIDSVLGQKTSDYELIVVDDGSTDDTPGILSSYGKDVRVIRQPNRGVSAARNRGIAAAKGEYVAFLDSDDLWLPNKLTAQLDFFRTHPAALICQTDEIWIRRGVRVNPRKHHRKPSGMIFEASLALCLVSPSAVMIKRLLLGEVGTFDEDLRVCEDYDLWLRIGYKYPIYLIERPLIVKRGGHSDQISKGIGLDKLRITSIARIIDRRVLSAHQHQAAVRALGEKCSIYASGCRKRGRAEEAAYYERLAEKYANAPGS